MSDFPNFADLRRIFRDGVLTRNARLTKEAVERKGSVTDINSAGACAAAEEVVNQLARVASAGFTDSARDEDLDRLLFDRTGLLRKPAAPAIGSVVFTTTAVNPAAFTIPIGTKLQSTEGTQFETTESGVFAAALTTGPTLAVRSILAGANQQAKVGTITSVISQITGIPTDLKVNNLVATTGAADKEDDNSYRDRGRKFFVTARRGTLAAIEQGALAVPGVASAQALEVLDSSGRPAKTVLLVITDKYTDKLAQLDQNPPAYQTQSQVLTNAVFSALSDVRAAGIPVTVVVAQVILQTVLLQLTFAAGVNVDDVAFRARAAIVNHINGLKPGQGLSVADLRLVLQSVSGLVITGSELQSPIGDVLPKSLQVLRSTLALVSANSLQTDRPLTFSTNPDAYQQLG